MKTHKFGIFTAIMFCMLADTVATADIIANSADKNEPSNGQIHFVKDEKKFPDSKIVNLDTSGNHRLEVKTKDEPDAMTWDAAVIAVKKHGLGWRLPTITELGLMYEQRKRIGGFEDEDYWSAKEQDINSAWIQGFRLGDQDRYNKQSKIKVRAVRSFLNRPGY